MDGNGRWAESRGLPRIEGHRVGLESVRNAIRYCVRHNIPVLSIFAFSSENWARPAAEVDFLMELFVEALDREIKELHEKGVRMRFVGDRGPLSSTLSKRMQSAEKLTSTNTQLSLNVMMNYGGKWDIVQAAKAIARQVADGLIKPEDIDETMFASLLSVSDLPEPDLFIRTSGEQRISNFFLWQLAYTEFYFTDVHWPDFNDEEFDKALACFSQRKRRYGLTSNQLREQDHV